jgi:hypothetical protein
MKTNFILAMVIAVSLGLGGCENVRADIQNSLADMKRDFSFPVQSPAPVPTAETEMAAAPVVPVPSYPPQSRSHAIQTVSPSSSGNCPEVRIVADLNQVHQFTHGDKPQPQENISSIWMRDVQDECAIVKNNVAIDITLAFEGAIGPKGKLHAGDKPGFSYPYFVAITNNEGQIIAKEVFAVTLSYDSDEKTRTKIEKIRQVIPSEGQNYKNHKILIGFQLNDQELAFNRTQAAPMVEPAAGAP